MAGVLDHDATNVVIKKEIEDNPESPEHTEVQDSPQSQPETNGSQKHSKVWSEDEVRSMIELHKNYIQRFKDGNYSKKMLLEDVAQELNLIGYDATPEKVRNKMKYLRSRYKGVLEYNAKHVTKRNMPFQEELAELYKMDYYTEQEPLYIPEVNGNGSNDISFNSNSGERVSKRIKSIPASHVDLRTVVTTKKKNNTVTKAKILKKKAQSKRTQPLYQCGLCMSKFQTSNHMHDHACIKTALKVNLNSNKKKASQNAGAHVFHWNSLITMQFLDLLKEYQDSHKNSNFRKVTLWLKPTGNAPILKNKKWTVEKKQTIAMIMEFLKKYMDLEPSASMILYVNQSFAPSPDIEVGNVYDCFNINGKLVLHYSTSPAWG